MNATNLSPLGLTYVLYNSTSHKAELAALITLSPILLMPVYAGIIVKTRELTVINMMVGQLASDVLNHILKYVIKQERPQGGLLGDGYGFPSSHSQYMGYFAVFLLLHLFFRHEFVSYGPGLQWLDLLQRALVYALIISWSFGVAFSRYFLKYHTLSQVMAGYGIGLIFGVIYYLVTEPARLTSHAARLRTALLDSNIARYWRIRDGWVVYSDGGVEEEWIVWRKKYEALTGGLKTRAKRD